MISPSNIFFLIQISIISSCSLQFKYREHTNHFEKEIQKLEEMKDHLDKKFPKMAMKDMESFKLMVQIFGVQMEDKEKELN